MDTFRRYLRLASGGFFLRNEAFVEMRGLPGPFTTGLILIIIVGLVISGLALVGVTLESMSAPDLAEIKDAVWRGMVQMPFYEEMPSEARDEMRRNYDWGWQAFPPLFGARDPFTAAIDVLVTPLAFLIGWLLYGFLAHIFAKIFGGTGNLSQTYGCTAMAVTPQLVNVAQVIPNVSIWGGLVAVWSLACDYLALKHAHHLTPARAFWVTLLPFIALVILVAIIVTITAIVVSLLGYVVF